MNPTRAVRSLVPLGPLMVAALLIGGCGDDSSDDSTAVTRPSPTSSPDAGTSVNLTVEAHDIDFDRDVYRTAAGPLDIEYVQEGALPHSLAIETSDGDVDGFKLEVDEAEVDRGTVNLRRGDYLLYCDVPGHRNAGMEAELHVE